MSYTPQTWSDLPSQTTPITAARLSHMETQYDAVAADIDDPATPVGAALTAAADATVAQQVESGPLTGAALDAKSVNLRGGIFLGFAAQLNMGVESTGLYVSGDSTTTDDNAWFRLFANRIATDYPAFTCRYWKWNNTTQKYDRPILLSNTGNKRRIVMATGETRVGRSSAGPNITGTIEVEFNGKSPNWSSGATQMLATKWTVDTQVSWTFSIGGDNVLRFAYSTDGSTTLVSMAATTTHGLIDGQEYWIKVQFTPNDGAGNRVAKFFRSTDGVTYTQIGATVTTAGAVTIYAGTSYYTVGARGSSSQAMVSGTEIYELWVRDGIDGAPVIPPLVHTWNRSIGTGIDTLAGDPEVNFILGAYPGAGIGYTLGLTGYLTDPIRFPKMSVDLGQQIAFFSSSHNEYHLTFREFEDMYVAWVENTTARMPSVQRIALTQNPRTGTFETSSGGIGHRARRAQLLSWTRANAIDVLDTYQAFIDDGRPMTTLINDGVHPTAEGYIVWYNVLLGEFIAAKDRTL